MATEYKEIRDVDGVSRGAVQMTKDGVTSIIPANPENRDYATFLEYKKQGGIIIPPDDAKVDPEKDAKDQAKTILSDDQKSVEERLDAVSVLLGANKP